MTQRAATLIAFAILGLFTVAAGLFAQAQAIWIDETTQMLGLAMPLGTQLQFLLGQPVDAWVMQPDRMPPLAYWLGSLWAGMFGLTEGAMRWMGILFVLGGAPAVYLTGRRLGGAVGGLVALGFLYLSPNLVLYAVEIRSYPVFFFFAAWAVYFFAQVVDGDRAPAVAYWGLAIAAVLASYTHFFGVVMAASAYGAVLLDHLLRRKPWRVLQLSIAVSLIAVLGLVPFVLHAVSISGSAGADGTPPPAAPGVMDIARDIARLAFRVFAHSSHVAWPVAFGLTLAGFVPLCMVGLWNILRAKETRQPVAFVIPLVLAALVLPILAFAAPGLTILSPTYNIWILPFFALLLALAFARNPSSWRLGLTLGVGVMGQLIAMFMLVSNATYFTHGPGEWIAQSIKLDASTLVAHDANGIWAQAYFPLAYYSNENVVQILVQQGAQPVLLLNEGHFPISDMAALLQGIDTVHYVSVSDNGIGETTGFIAEGITCGARNDTGWALTNDTLTPRDHCAIASASVFSGTASDFTFTQP